MQQVSTSSNGQKTRISVSQISTFLSCSYKWQLQYRKNIRVRTTELGPAALGDVVHVGIAAALRSSWEWRREYIPFGYDDLKAAINLAVDEWDAKNRPQDKTVISVVSDEKTVSLIPDATFYDSWDEMIDNAKALAFRTIQNINLLDQYEVVDIEVNGERVPLVEYYIIQPVPDTEFEFAGMVDAVLYNRLTGLVEVIDWKVRKTFTGVDTEQLNSQIGLYQHALRQLGVDAAVGVVYQIKSQAPSKPTLNKDGSMSRRRIITDWPTYLAALLEAGLDPAEYEDEMRDKLADIEFFRPLMVVRTSAVTTALWENMVAHARRISEETIFPRSYGYPCRYCPFADLCNAELYGYDVDELFETRYEIIDRASFKQDDEEAE